MTWANQGQNDKFAHWKAKARARQIYVVMSHILQRGGCIFPMRIGESFIFYWPQRINIQQSLLLGALFFVPAVERDKCRHKSGKRSEQIDNASSSPHGIMINPSTVHNPNSLSVGKHQFKICQTQVTSKYGKKPSNYTYTYTYFLCIHYLQRREDFFWLQMTPNWTNLFLRWHVL